MCNSPRARRKIPLSDAELANKVASLIDPVLGAPRRREIVATVAALDELADMEALIRLLVRGGQAKAA